VIDPMPEGRLSIFHIKRDATLGGWPEVNLAKSVIY